MSPSEASTQHNLQLLGTQQTTIVKGLHIDYLYVDTRLVTRSLTLDTIYEGETTKPTRITVADVDEYAACPGTKRLFTIMVP